MELPRVGDVIQGKYELREILGKGGFAIVFRAYEPALDRDVAIKVLRPRKDEHSKNHVARFMQEARVLAGLRDPHTITLYDFGRTTDGLLYIASEYVQGETLGELIRRQGSLDAAVVIHILQQLAQSLREAHAAGLLHRDIKPDNVIVYRHHDDPHRVKLIDFGIAKHTKASGHPELGLTREGAVVGTLRYMSPEQLLGEELTPASDIFSLGLITYEMLVGRPHDEGATDSIIEGRLEKSHRRVPSAIALPPALRRLVDEMLAREPSARLANADEVIRRLESVPATADTKARVAPVAKMARPGEPTVAKHAASTLATALAVAIMAAAAVGGVLFFVSRDDSTSQTSPSRPAAERETIAAQRPPRPIEPEPSALSTPEPADVGPTDTAVPPQLIDGCGNDFRLGSTRALHHVLGSERRWIVYVPRHYDPHRRYPLVLAFHDRSRSDETMLVDTGLPELADENGFVVAALDSRATGTAPWTHSTDLRFVEHVIEDTRDTLCIDPGKLFAIGHGSGAKMALGLACEQSLSGLATSGFRGEFPPECSVEPTPHITFTGEKNNYLPLAGGVTCTGSTVPSLAAREEWWEGNNGCAGRRARWLGNEHGTCEMARCPAESAFASCVTDGGRDWPRAGQRLFEVPGCNAGNDFPIGPTIWKFFREHGRDVDPNKPTK